MRHMFLPAVVEVSLHTWPIFNIHHQPHGIHFVKCYICLQKVIATLHIHVYNSVALFGTWKTSQLLLTKIKFHFLCGFRSSRLWIADTLSGTSNLPTKTYKCSCFTQSQNLYVLPSFVILVFLSKSHINQVDLFRWRKTPVEQCHLTSLLARENEDVHEVYAPTCQSELPALLSPPHQKTRWQLGLHLAPQSLHLMVDHSPQLRYLDKQWGWHWVPYQSWTGWLAGGQTVSVVPACSSLFPEWWLPWLWMQWRKQTLWPSHWRQIAGCLSHPYTFDILNREDSMLDPELWL